MLVALAMLIVAVIASSLGVSWQAATIMGGVVGMSSTAITLKQLSDDGGLAGQHGRLARRAGPRSRADFYVASNAIRPRPKRRVRRRQPQPGPASGRGEARAPAGGHVRRAPGARRTEQTSCFRRIWRPGWRSPTESCFSTALTRSRPPASSPGSGRGSTQRSRRGLKRASARAARAGRRSPPAGRARPRTPRARCERGSAPGACPRAGSPRSVRVPTACG